jgi:hypothetical protein
VVSDPIAALISVLSFYSRVIENDVAQSANKETSYDPFGATSTGAKTCLRSPATS